MRLMLLGSEQTGKTSLLQAFKRESFNIQQTQRRVKWKKKNFIIFKIIEYISSNQQQIVIFQFFIYPNGYMIKHLEHY